ncbi:ribosomal RNA processing protein 36 homolog [Solea solea]|uniref:ribosomal RNA processing protein 36 homolog n=1 Tax=Solea solea TaxID=90069 RepID=UPI00272AF0AC|nr:ribosomal RNA processing protein 36 homolog [Solea solea]
MKVKEKQKLTRMMSSSSDEDSDVEKNFALLTERRGGGEGEEGDDNNRDKEEEEEEEEEGPDGAEEEEEEEVGEAEGEGLEEDDDDDDEEDDDDDDSDEDLEAVGGSSEIQTREDLKKELSTMSFEDIMKLQKQVGTKVYNKVAYGDDDKRRATGKKKRRNKNRPMEISAKKPAPFLRQVVPVRKPTLRDPRFDDLSGEYKPEIFEKTYKFIDDIKHGEKEEVRRQLKKTKTSGEKKEKLQFLLKRMENQERAKTSREQQRERELQLKKQQRERANHGARPFFLKKSDKKKLELAEKYQDLKKSGKLETFLSKKRKRNAGKDRRKLPPNHETS